MNLPSPSRWVLVCWLLGCCAFAGCSRSGQGTIDVPEKPGDDPLDPPRAVVRKALDPPDYYAALELVNKHLNNQPDALARFDPPDRAAFRQLLTERLALDEDEMNEVDNPRFTPLDAHHLAFCFLLRDAARSLRLPERTDATAADKTAQALHQARVAFDWTVRQVLLEEKGGDLRPPQFVLPEGRGGSRERALVFLALLHQLGLDGCMIAFPADGSEALNYRLAGVLLPGEGGGIYLFDPKLGVPLPAPKGKGVATLDQFRAPKEQKEIFAQLNLDDTYRYDITPEQATKGEVHLVFPLSALSTRMRYLE
ncbi:MAG TPA: hypothetical protein VEL76_04295, partial [Gemmataceae bacterium]|nr:hypothetical protein [Gemmataceae bacterium]